MTNFLGHAGCTPFTSTRAILHSFDCLHAVIEALEVVIPAPHFGLAGLGGRGPEGTGGPTEPRCLCSKPTPSHHIHLSPECDSPALHAHNLTSCLMPRGWTLEGCFQALATAAAAAAAARTTAWSIFNRGINKGCSRPLLGVTALKAEQADQAYGRGVAVMEQGCRHVKSLLAWS